MGNTFTTQRTKQLKTPTKWTFDFLVNLLFKLLEFLQDANVINKDAIAAQIDQVIQVLELMDVGPWINFWKARRQVKAEQASGAIGDYFTFLDSMLNGCHQRAQQQSSAKPAEKPEENGEKQEMKN